ncbi:MAG TPA: aromatic ring-hydroxylating dioxygenase subunit alpha [Alphaproteobacteria bacterium]|nr:aromatic ring-hydroxylating dioxygenase subunit alpha [Alphaproteobacteria bacterium]
MSAATVDKSTIEALVNQGLRNRWYPVAPSWQVGTRPIGVTRLGQNIVIWRDTDGSPHALEDRCPHRGARLSLGWNLGDRLACWYHGIEVGGDGEVKTVPAVEGCPLEGTKPIVSYPVREIGGAVFAYFGDAAHPEPVELILPEELANTDEYATMLCTAIWRCNYRYAVDNVMDPMHGAYLHAQSHSMAEGDKQASMKVSKTATGLVFEKESQLDINFDWVEFSDTGALFLRLAIPYRKSAGPGGLFGIVGCVTPIDETICQVYFWRNRKVSGWQRDLWRFMYRNRLEGLHWDVLEQDRVVLENMTPNARDREFLYQHDTGMARLRRILETKAKSQLEALAALEREAAAAE